MHDGRRVSRALILFLVAWIVLDFGLTVEGAFDFNTDESLVWSSTAAPTPALPSRPLASRDAVPDTATTRPTPRGRPSLQAPSPHLVPRSRLASATDPGGGPDDD